MKTTSPPFPHIALHAAAMEGLISTFSAPLASKLLLLYVYNLLAACYVYGAVHKHRAGLARTLLSSPVIVLNLVLPSMLDHTTESILVTPIAGCMSLAAFKVLALCLNRGPLMLQLSPLQFVGVMLLPIIPAQVFAVSGGQKIPEDQGGADRGEHQLLADYGKQIATSTTVACILCAFPDLHWFPRYWLYTLCSCMALGAVFDLLGAVAAATLQIKVAPTFNRPWMSDSFADFWARRWNLTTTYMMRVLVYEPILQGQLVAAAAAAPNGMRRPAAAAEPHGLPDAAPASHSSDEDSGKARDDEQAGLLQHRKPSDVSKPGDASTERAAAGVQQEGKAVRPRVSKARRFWGLQATFMFSGVWHILVFWYNTRVVSARWALFFIIQAPIVMLEMLLGKVWAKAHLPPLPHALRVVLTNAALIAVAGPLFFGPADDTGFAQQNIRYAQPILDGAVWVGRRVWGTLHGPDDASKEL